MESDTPTPAPERAASSEESAAAARLKRSKMIEKFREQALRKANAFAANLAVINSDLMVFAQGNEESVSPPPPEGSPEESKRFEHQANLHLRIVREINRLAQMDEQLANRGESQARDGAEAKN